jgi:hypothetical protein
MTPFLSLLFLLLASPAPFGEGARVAVDPDSRAVRAAAAMTIPVRGVSLDALITDFFTPHRQRLGVDPAELTVLERRGSGDLTVVVLGRRIDGIEVADSRLTLSIRRGERLVRYEAEGPLGALARPQEVLARDDATRAAREVLPDLPPVATGELVFFRGRAAWRLRFALALPATSDVAPRPVAPYAPIVYVDAATGAVMSMSNGMIR